MKRNDCLSLLLAILIVVGIWGLFWWALKDVKPQQDYAFLRCQVSYGRLPEHTAEVSANLKEYVGFIAFWNGRAYHIRGIYYPYKNPYKIIFSGNHKVYIEGERIIPIFRSGKINDFIINGGK